jgi:hypothetical protein
MSPFGVSLPDPADAQDVEIELVCPNDGCFGYDVDQEPGRTPQVLRNTWTVEAQYHPHPLGGLSMYDDECPLCGTPGEEGE